MIKKYRQYRMMKQVEKLLNTPAKKEEIYTPIANLYIGSKSLHQGVTDVDPNHKLRMAQVETVARLLLNQISQLEEAETRESGAVDEDSGQAISKTLVDVELTIEELDCGVLFTEAQKTSRRLQLTEQAALPKLTREAGVYDLGALRSQIEDWQQQKNRQKKKLSQMENSIRELALNVNDVRCAQVARDRKKSAAALASSIDSGITLLKETFAELTSACAAQSIADKQLGQRGS